jgi:hypothetical protein
VARRESRNPLSQRLNVGWLLRNRWLWRLGLWKMDNYAGGTPVDLTFEQFESQLRAQGFDTVLERKWGPSAVAEAHSHPFETRAGATYWVGRRQAKT